MPVELRTITNLQQNARIREIKDGLAQFTLAGPYGYLLDADAERLRSARWITFEMGELIEKRDAVLPVLTYLFHWLERHVFDGSPTLLVLDEAWRFLSNGVFAEKIREWEKEMRKHNVAVLFSTQSLVDVTNSEFSQAIIESSLTKVFLPNREALKPETRRSYENIGLNSRQIQLISSATPKLDYYVSCPAGNRMFNLNIGDIGLALCGSSSREDHRIADAIVQRGGNFLVEWLRYKRLHQAADYIEGGAGGNMAAE
jgi:type IV secretion system protein VirB4